MSYNPLLEKSNHGELETERTSFDGHVETSHCHSCQRLGRFRRRLSFCNTVFVPLALAVILALLAVNIAQAWTDSDIARQDVTHSFYGHDRSYMSLDHKYDHLWEPHRAEAGTVMQPLYPGGEEVVGTVGMFHQLHCLASFRKALQRASAGENIGVDDWDNGHWPHCLHYVRQAIHCAADDTVERLRLQNGSLGAQSITGQWDVRRCGNSDKLFAFDKSHAACGKDDGSYGRCT